MDMERNMIMQAQADSKGKNPGISAQEMEEAQERSRELNGKIENITDEWHDKLVEVRDQCERVLNETEVREFQTRIAKLQEELSMKTREIDQINRDKKRIEEAVDKTLDLEIDLKKQTEEIDELNERYRKALKDKVSVYDELSKAVKMLAERNASFMENEIEICRLTNLTSITKKELEQKEKIHQELKENIDAHDNQKQMNEAKDSKIREKQDRIETLSKEVYEKDKMIEQLNALHRKREA